MKKLLSLLTAFLVVLAGCGSSSDVFTYTVANPIETMDPVSASYSQTFDLFADIYVGLLKVDNNGELTNGIAKDIQVSDDGLTYTITLRDDVKWVDNTGAEMGTVTAHDFEFAYKRMVDPANASVYSYIFDGIENASAIIAGEKDADTLGVTAKDDTTLEIKLEYVAPYFESMLAFASFVPQPEAGVEQYGKDYGTSAETTWYNGPYYATDYDTQYVISVEKNPLYFDADNVSIENIDFRLSQDGTARYNAFTGGEVDYAEISNNEDYTTAKEEGIVTDSLTAYSFYAVLNQQDSAATSNENLRKALEYGFDRDTLVKNIYGEINQSITYIMPSDITPVAYDGEEYRDYAEDELVTYDKEKANEYFDAYMKDMGYSDRSEVTVEFLAGADASGQSKAAEAVQAFYKQEFGITVNTTVQPFEQFVASRSAGAFDMLITGWGPDYADPSTYFGLWTTAQIGAQNTAGYSNPEYDKVYEQAVAESDTQKRFELFGQLEQMLVEDGVLIPFYQKNAPYLLADGYDKSTNLFLKISDEYLEAK